MSEPDPDPAAPAQISTRGPELAMAAFLMGLAVLVITDSLRVGHRWASDGPQSGYFPFYIGLALAGSSLAIAVGVLRRWRAAAGEPFVDAVQARSVWAVLWPTAAYLGSMHWIGLYLGSALLIAWFMRRHGRFGWAATAAVALGVPTVVYAVFERWFLVLLPKGQWVEAALSALGR